MGKVLRYVSRKSKVNTSAAALRVLHTLRRLPKGEGLMVGEVSEFGMVGLYSGLEPT